MPIPWPYHETFAGNAASGKVATRCGFEPEGTLRARYVHRGVPVDAVSFSRIRTVAEDRAVADP